MPFNSRKWIILSTSFILQSCLVLGEEGIDGLSEEISINLKVTESSCDCAPIHLCYAISASDHPCRLGEVCCDDRRNTSVFHRTPGTCGLKNENQLSLKLSKSTETEPYKFPWMIAMLKKTFEDNGQNNLAFRCSGSLIHPRVVLTAALCVASYVNKTDEIVLRAGQWDSKSETESMPHQEIQAEKIVVHADFDIRFLSNNIALVFLKESFHFAENVDVVCLPPQYQDVDHQKCILTKWGKESFDDALFSNILEQLSMPIVPRDDCEKILRNNPRLASEFNLHESFLCTKNELQDEPYDKRAESGSPLVCPIRGKVDNYYQVGVTAWATSSSQIKIQVFTNVARFRTWIDEQFAKNNWSNETKYYNYS